MRRIGLAVALLLLAVSPAGAVRAGDPAIGEHLAAARALLEKRDHRAALKQVGDALLLAHEGGDIAGESEAVPVLEALARSLPEKPAADGEKGPPGRREAMALLMARMAHTRAGALVSANALARNLAFLAVENGDEFNSDVSSSVVCHWSGAKDSGAVADFFAEWLVRVESMNLVGSIGTRGGLDGFPMVRKKIAEAAINGWADEATHAATDLARFQIKWKQDVGGLAAMTQAEEACRAAGDAAVLERWQKCIDRRLGTAIPSLLQPIQRLAGKLPAVPPGTAGVDRPAGATGLGDAFAGMKSGSILVRVSRNDKCFDVVPAWKPKEKIKVPYGPGARFLDGDGLILVFQGRAVGLYALNLDGHLGVPGDGMHDLSFRSLYPIAKGETWSLRKDGTVTLTR
jgi:hypothetical protein